VTTFEFHPANVTPQTQFEVAPESARTRITNLEPDDARIAAARARGMAHSRDMNAPGAQYGFGFPESHYTDFAGLETSDWDAGVLVCIAEILEVPILKRSRWVWTHDKYDPRTGNYILSDVPAVTIAELKSAIDARIVELGLSKPLIWEWFADVHEPIGQEWWRVDLQTRIQRFKAA
jgi:hypothetical protein